jgi:hypothetical protein
LPLASGFIFWIRVLTKSKGSEHALAKNPEIRAAAVVLHLNFTFGPRRSTADEFVHQIVNSC